MFYRTSVLLFLSLALAGCSNLGLRRSPEAIEAAVLKATPLGSSPERVLAVAKENGWKNVRVNSRTGFYKQEPPKPGVNVGVSSLSAVLGEYKPHPLLVTSVEVFWGFDKDRKLIAIWAWKTTDGP